MFRSWHAWPKISHSKRKHFGWTFVSWTYTLIPFLRKEEISIRCELNDIVVIVLEIMSTSSYEVLDRNKFREYGMVRIDLPSEIYGSIRSYYENRTSILWRMLRKLSEFNDGKRCKGILNLGLRSRVIVYCWVILATIWSLDWTQSCGRSVFTIQSRRSVPNWRSAQNPKWTLYVAIGIGLLVESRYSSQSC